MKKIIAFFTVLPLFFAVCFCAPLSYGSSGDDVSALQQALADKGYDVGEIDGIYGTKTREAVKHFQEDNSLTVDGIAGPQTLEALKLKSSGTNSSADIYLIARAVYAEARGEEYLGKVAVAAIILNRVDDANFPNTVSGVVYQPGAFDSVSDGQINLAPDEECIRAARDAYGGYDPTDGCVYYYNPATATNKWMLSKEVILTVGNHVFCR